MRQTTTIIRRLFLFCAKQVYRNKITPVRENIAAETASGWEIKFHFRA
jgi:hypothetical protein